MSYGIVHGSSEPPPGYQPRGGRVEMVDGCPVPRQGRHTGGDGQLGRSTATPCHGPTSHPEGMTIMELLDVVLLLEDLPRDGLRAGAAGTVVHVFQDPAVAYQVEFSDHQGTDVLTTVLPSQVQPAPGVVA